MIGLLGIAGLIGLTLYLDSSSPSGTTEATSTGAESVDTNPSDPEPSEDEDATLVEAPPDLGPAPAVIDIDGWINTTATDFDSIPKTVRVVQFWTFGCYNCKNTLPHLQTLYADYDRSELEIIGLHAPEFDREADPDNVAAASEELGVTWPVGLDTDKTNFRAWQGDRRFWPRTYVLDQNDHIRFDHIGEGAYDELAATVDWLVQNGP